MNAEAGRFAVRLARRAIEEYLLKGTKLRPEGVPEELREEKGVFVTLKTYPDMALRGCIGYPEPVMPLAEAIVETAVSSAFGDPRFPPLKREELGKVVVEVTVLTPPEPINTAPSELPKAIKVGRDGLIVRCGYRSGLLLPQVPVEWGWDEVEFLSHTCMKAGLQPDCWKRPECRFYRFQGQIFTEVCPSGNVVEETPKR